MKIFSLLMLPCLLLLFPCSPFVAVAQTAAPSAPVWTMQDSGVTASLRGIHSVDKKIAWASGSNGTVLHTSDGGEHWIKCEIPDGKKDGAKLDFRGVQAWDEKTAIVMASGPGELSRLYKTTDGCKTWKLIFMNPDKDGFWDAFKISKYYEGWLLGDPVNGKFSLFYTNDTGKSWNKLNNDGLHAETNNDGAFAASNSSLMLTSNPVIFVTGGKNGAKTFSPATMTICVDDCDSESELKFKRKEKWIQQSLPIGKQTDGSGAFAINNSKEIDRFKNAKYAYIVVGGDYAKPNETNGTAAWSKDFGMTWTSAVKPPHGYRSTVQWDSKLNLWITAGTNGSDVSRDDGKTWQPLDDGNWNALSLPFIVGPNGRIGRLNENAIPPVNPQATSPAR